MTIGKHTISGAEEDTFFNAIDRVNRAGNAVRVIAWALGVIVVAGLSVAAWVATVNRVQMEHTAALQDMKPRLAILENRAVVYDAAPPPSREQIFELDKRLARMEQSASTLKEQNAMIIQELRNIQGKN